MSDELKPCEHQRLDATHCNDCKDFISSKWLDKLRTENEDLKLNVQFISKNNIRLGEENERLKANLKEAKAALLGALRTSELEGYPPVNMLHDIRTIIRDCLDRECLEGLGK